MINKHKSNKVNTLICLIFILIFNCNKASLKEYELNGNYPIQNAINITINGKKQSTLYPLNIYLKLYTSIPKKKEIPKFESANYSYTGFIENNLIKLDINEGRYFGILEIDNHQYYPMLFSNFASIRIIFGFTYSQNVFGETKLETFASDTCVWKSIENTFYLKQIVCPPLLINKTHKFSAIVNIDESATFSETKTVGLWFAAVYTSLYTISPAGLIIRIVFGPIAVERKITENLTK
jgi:hypothetical protein